VIVVGRGKPVIDPFEVYVKKGVKIPSGRVVLLFHPKLFRIAKRMLESVSSVKFSGVVFRSAVGRYRGVEIFISLPFWGAPAAAACLEALIAAGGRLFIAVGRAGSLSPQAESGRYPDTHVGCSRRGYKLPLLTSRCSA